MNVHKQDAAFGCNNRLAITAEVQRGRHLWTLDLICALSKRSRKVIAIWASRTSV